MSIHTKEALNAAAGEIIREWGLGRYSQKKRYRDRRRHSKLLGGNPLLTAPPTSEPMFVYVVCAEGGPVKIGIAKDVANRLAGIQTGHPEKLRVFFHTSAQDARAVERECHLRLADRRLNGEWFNCDPFEAAELVRQIAAS